MAALLPAQSSSRRRSLRIAPMAGAITREVLDPHRGALDIFLKWVQRQRAFERVERGGVLVPGHHCCASATQPRTASWR